MKSFIKYIVIIAISGTLGYLTGISSVNKKVKAEVYREKRADGLLDSLKQERLMLGVYRDMSEDLIDKSTKKDRAIMDVIVRLDKISKETIRKELLDIAVDEKDD